MAKLTEIIVAIEAEGVDKVLNALKTVDGAQAKVADNSKQSANTQKSANRTSAESWALLATGVNQAMQIIQTAIQAGKAVYDFTKEGAQLDFMKDKFSALTESIGDTSVLLLGDLRQATSGLMSDAELMESATTMMTLGLANTREEAIRLTAVSSQLGMNMNQLVLTLTNETTMRFDQLGIKVDGFKEKVKSLEDAGYSASDAFKEAFLQQAEEQIAKVGSVAESSVGSFKLMEAGIKNLADAAKESLLDVVAPAIEKIGSYLAEQGLIAQADVTFKNLIEDMNAAILPTTKLKQAMYELTNKNSGLLDPSKFKEFTDLMATYSNYLNVATTGTQGWADANYEGSDSAIAAQIAVAALNNEIKDAEFSTAEYIETATGLGAQLSFMTDKSDTYADLLAEIAAKEAELAGMKPWQQASESGRELQGEIDILLGKLDDLSTKMKVQALQAAIEANGDVTEKEYGMMLDYMQQAGIINQETKIKMMQDWRELNDFQQGLRWDAEGNVTLYTEQALKSIEELKRELQSIERNIGITVSVNQMGRLPGIIGQYTDTGGEGTGDIYGNALGGAVYPGQNYTWQEPDRDGELLIPERYGRVMNQMEVIQAMREAMSPSGVTSSQKASQETVINNYYTLNMPTSNNSADVRTAFELMEAWNR